MPPSTAQRSLIRRFFLTWPGYELHEPRPRPRKTNETTTEAKQADNSTQKSDSNGSITDSLLPLAHISRTVALSPFSSPPDLQRLRATASAPPRPKPTTNDESDKHDGTTA
eukprot:CAMPEP_0172039650 /NCGR_PEP_ID=MMETSP1041-20130122/24022_1 /TAXON_ID=464988 /ORGANISM="Hemiselmis andersenii, Strain CCMP439" /LENGTH=110 /DNA_ID=CAMNT_0012697383 /DNA_START=450 /DNA_END=779 /DNA_ORIENTATION=-